MNESSKDKFDWMVSEEEKALGNTIQVTLSAKEIEFIKAALDVYRRQDAILALNEVAVEMLMRKDPLKLKEVHDPIEDAFKKAWQYNGLIEIIENKLNESITDAIEEHKRQRGLNL